MKTPYFSNKSMETTIENYDRGGGGRTVRIILNT